MTDKINQMEKSFFKYVIPSIVSTMLGGLYIVVDGFFVGNSMGDDGLTAINLIYPVGTILFASAGMLGMGGSVVMSTYLGAGDIENFNKAKINTFITLILAGIILSAFLLIIKNKLIYHLGARGIIFEYADNYITTIILGGILQLISSGSMPIIRNSGKTFHAMCFMGTGLITNIILDYVFLMVLRLSDFDLSITKRAFQIGLSPFGLIMAPSLIVIFNNLQCIKYGGYIGTSAYSVINYIYSSIVYLFEGIGEGCQPMISFFKGAKREDLMRKVLKKGILFSLVFGFILTIIVLSFKDNIGILFGASVETNNIISIALPIIAIAFILQPIVRIGTAYFYSSSESKYASFLTYIDPLFVSPLCIMVLPMFFKLNGVWLAMPVTQIILLSLFFIIYYNTNIKKTCFDNIYAQKNF